MLTRDVENGMFFGVCAGLADHLGINAALVRIAAILLFFATGTIIGWIYLIAAVLMPSSNTKNGG